MARQDYQSFNFKMTKKSFMGKKDDKDDTFHNFHELFYVSEGECSVFLGERILSVKSGDFVLIPAGTIHKTKYLSRGANTKYVISFSKEVASDIDGFLNESVVTECMKPGSVTAPLKRREYVETLLQRMYFELTESKEHAESVFKVCLTELLLSILRYVNNESEERQENALNDEMQRVAEYIAGAFNKDISLTTLSEKFALSPSYLSRSFKAATGFGIKEYITNLRIQRSARLLLESEKSITDIAYECGFNDSNYFGDAFKKAVGVSPSRYRRIG